MERDGDRWRDGEMKTRWRDEEMERDGELKRDEKRRIEITHVNLSPHRWFSFDK